MLSTPDKEQEYLNQLAKEAWVKELTKGRKLSLTEARALFHLQQNNIESYKKEFSRHTSHIRRTLSDVLDLKQVLHPHAIDLLKSLKEQNFGLVVFDECHHLTDYWAAVMIQLVRQLGSPIIVGLTGTPPEDKSLNQKSR